jgi:hypothetical protein
VAASVTGALDTYMGLASKESSSSCKSQSSYHPAPTEP